MQKWYKDKLVGELAPVARESFIHDERGPNEGGAKTVRASLLLRREVEVGTLGSVEPRHFSLSGFDERCKFIPMPPGAALGGFM